MNTTYNLNTFHSSRANIQTITSITISLLKIYIQKCLYYVMSLFHSKYNKPYIMLSSLFNIVYNIDADYQYFLTNTYNFETNNKHKLSFVLPESCNDITKYMTSFNNSIRSSLRIKTDTEFLNIFYIFFYAVIFSIGIQIIGCFY